MEKGPSIIQRVILSRAFRWSMMGSSATGVTLVAAALLLAVLGNKALGDRLVNVGWWLAAAPVGMAMLYLVAIPPPWLDD